MSQDATGDHLVSPEPFSDFSDLDFAARLREVRLMAGITQQQLVDRMAIAGHKMHRSAIAKVESGERPVTIGEAVQFAGILGIPLDDLVTGPGLDDARRERIEAQVAVRSLQYEAIDRSKLLHDQQVLHDDTMTRLKAAQRHLRDVSGRDDQ